MLKSKKSEQIIIHQVSEDDIEELLSLESRLFKDCWNKQQLKNELEKKSFFVKALKESPNTIAGFLIAQLIFPEAELLRIAIRPEDQCKGIGSMLHDYLIRNLSVNNYQSIYLEVRISNQAAINFYLKNGYKLIAQRKNYYSFPSEDALIMKRELIVL